MIPVRRDDERTYFVRLGVFKVTSRSSDDVPCLDPNSPSKSKPQNGIANSLGEEKWMSEGGQRYEGKARRITRLSLASRTEHNASAKPIAAPFVILGKAASETIRRIRRMEALISQNSIRCIYTAG